MTLARSVRDNLRFLRGNMLVITITRLMGMFGRQMVNPYASLFILALGGEPEQIGLINALLPLAGLLMLPLGGYLADRAGRVNLIAAGSLYSACVYLLYAIAPTWQWIALGAFLIGFRVFQFPPQSAIIADSLAPRDRGKGIATMNTISGLLGISSPFIAGWVVDTYGEKAGIRALYVVLVLVYFATSAINRRFLKEPAGRTTESIKLRDLPRAIRDAYACIPDTLRQFPRSLRVMAAFFVLLAISNAIAGPFWVVYASQVIGLSATEWGLILLLSTLIRLIAYIPGGAWVDRHGRTRFVIAGLVITLVTMPLFVFSTQFVHVLIIRLVLSAVNGFFGPACSALMADIVPRDMRGRVMACLGRGQVFIGSTGGGSGGPGMGYLMTIPVMLAALAGGVLYSANPRLPWFLAFGATGIALALSALYLRDPEAAEV